MPRFCRRLPGNPEEIAIRNREMFEEAGGKSLEYIPALNDSAAHVEALRSVVLEMLEQSRQGAE
jgi:protoheme ferro-lyase